MMNNISKIPHILISILLCLSPSTGLPSTVGAGDTAPPFTLENSKGQSVSLSDFADKTVILEWTNHDCPFVRKHYSSDNMQRLQKLYTSQDVIWLSIISSAPGKQGHVTGAEAQELTTSRNAKPTAVLLDPDGTVGRLYSARTTPHMFIIDKNGIIRYAGAIDSINSASVEDIPKAENYLASAMTELMAGKSVSTPQTAPYGCSIKF